MKLDYQRHTRGRYFENAFLERASKVHPATPFVFYLPLLGALSGWAWSEGLTPLSVAVPCFVLGIGVWQVMEYAIHRAFFHFEGRSPLGRRVHEIVHGYHHRYPDDEARLVMPLGASLPLAALIASGLYLLSAPAYTLPLFVGIVTGYLFYDFTHWSTHFRTPLTRWGRKIRAHHMAHHFAVPDLHFGISHTWLDRLLKTVRPAESPTRSPSPPSTTSDGSRASSPASGERPFFATPEPHAPRERPR